MKRFVYLLLAVLLVVLTILPNVAAARTYSPCDAPAYAVWAMAACGACIAASVFTFGNVSGCYGSVTISPPAESLTGKQPIEQRAPSPTPGDADGLGGLKR